MRSLSSWRAWIEMRILLSTCKRRPSRSPHGERGLKFPDMSSCARTIHVALLMESVD